MCAYVSGIQVRGPLPGSKLVSRARLVACRSSDSLFQLLDTPKFSWGSSLETVVPDARQTATHALSCRAKPHLARMRSRSFIPERSSVVLIPVSPTVDVVAR